MTLIIINHSIFFFFFFFLLFLVTLVSAGSSIGFNEGKNALENVTRSHFPVGFLFGVATSAYQIEGAYLEDGKSLNNWDVFCRIEGSIANGDNGYIADDHYHRYLEDIERLHYVGVDAYRFSISWSRILPKGRFGEVNPAGIAFYNKIIDDLQHKGIEPFVTIHHQDFPQELEDTYGAWLSPLMQEDFVLFAETCFENFGDRVKYWMTINEPNLFAEMAYERGSYPPARCSPPFGNCSAGNSDIEPLIAVHNMLLAHGKAVKLYRKQFQLEQSGFIGIVVHAFMYEPLIDDKHDKEAASRALAFNVAWTLDPLVFGDYPPEMLLYLGSELPTFTSEERELIKGSIDFIALNHYSTLYAKDCIHTACICIPSMDPSCLPGGDRVIQGFVATVGVRDGVLIGEPTGVPRFSVVPRGMEEIVEYLKQRYHNMPMFVTENGYSSPDNKAQVDEIEDDIKRIEFHKSYLAHLARAIRNGADVRGYFLWSLMDDFEWVNGYDARFGLYYVEPQTLNRIPKSSARWYRDFITNGSLKNVDSKNSMLYKE